MDRITRSILPRSAGFILRLVWDAMGQGGIEEGLKLTKGLHVGDAAMPAGDGDIWLENSIRYSTALSAGASGVNQILAVYGGWQPIVFSVEEWDTDDIFDLSSSARMTINTPGVYPMHGYFVFHAGGSGVRGIGIWVNSTRIISALSYPNQTISINIALDATWPLEEGDYIQLLAYHDLSVTITILNQLFVVVRVP